MNKTRKLVDLTKVSNSKEGVEVERIRLRRIFDLEKFMCFSFDEGNRRNQEQLLFISQKREDSKFKVSKKLPATRNLFRRQIGGNIW